VSAQDDFFELGGDSITTLQVIARAAGRGLLLSPKLVFENPILRDLARVAASAQPAVAPAPAEAVAPGAQLSHDEWHDLLSELES
jgi:hypothetical protein